MTEDTVGFANNEARDQQVDDAKKILLVAADEPDLFNDWEKEFIEGSLEQIKRFGYGFKLSAARREAIERIKGKLDKEGIL